MWAQYDFGDGPIINGVKTILLVAWVAWSRFRVVIGLRNAASEDDFGGRHGASEEPRHLKAKVTVSAACRRHTGLGSETVVILS